MESIGRCQVAFVWWVWDRWIHPLDPQCCGGPEDAVRAMARDLHTPWSLAASRPSAPHPEGMMARWCAAPFPVARPDSHLATSAITALRRPQTISPRRQQRELAQVQTACRCGVRAVLDAERLGCAASTSLLLCFLLLGRSLASFHAPLRVDLPMSIFRTSTLLIEVSTCFYKNDCGGDVAKAGASGLEVRYRPARDARQVATKGNAPSTLLSTRDLAHAEVVNRCEVSMPTVWLDSTDSPLPDRVVVT